MSRQDLSITVINSAITNFTPLVHTLQNEMSPRVVSFILLVIHLHVFSITILSVPFLDFQIAIKADDMVCEEKRGHFISEHKIARRRKPQTEHIFSFLCLSSLPQSHSLRWVTQRQVSRFFRID